MELSEEGMKEMSRFKVNIRDFSYLYIKQELTEIYNEANEENKADIKKLLISLRAIQDLTER